MGQLPGTLCPTEPLGAAGDMENLEEEVAGHAGAGQGPGGERRQPAGTLLSRRAWGTAEVGVTEQSAWGQESAAPEPSLLWTLQRHGSVGDPSCCL